MDKYNRPNQNWNDAPSDLEVAIPVSMPNVIYPFENDTTWYLFEQDFICKKDWYPENVVDVGTPHQSEDGLIFIKDGDRTDLDGSGIVRFTRTFGILPGFTDAYNNPLAASGGRVEVNSYTWTTPGIGSAQSGLLPWWINLDTITFSGDYVTFYTLDGDHNLDTNYDIATIIYTVYDENSSQYLYKSYQSPIISRGSDWIQVNRIKYNAENLFYNYFSRPLIRINPTQKVVTSFTYFDYWVPGFNCNSPEDITIIQPWSITDENLNETDTITEVTDPPLFGTGGWREMIANKEWLCVEGSIIRLWQGNIYERATKYIKSQ